MNERPEATANAAETEPMDPKPATTAAAPAAPEPEVPAPDEPAPEAAAAEAPLDAAADDAAPAEAADAEADTAWQADDEDEDAVPDEAWPEEEAPARTVFADLGLSEEILRAVTEAGYQHPTPIQEQAIPVVMMGRDVLGCAQTGTGKTASFVLPMLDILTGSRAKMRMPRSLILEPTRELALQVAENFEKYGKYLKLNHALLIGGESMNDQRDVLEKGVDVLIATPGRLLDLFDRGRILLADCKLLVIDEADRMLDMGFIPDVERIVSLLPKLRQTLFFSATMAPEIRRLADAFLSNPREITVAPPASVATTIKAGLVYVQPHDKREALRCLIRSEQVSNALIFCNRKVDVDILYKSLKKHGFAAGALHGDMEQSARFATLNAFKAGELQLLVCSDVAARGIDIGGLSHVFNFDVPFRDEDYVHRIGRTGRAGREGHAYSIATADDVKLVQAIETLTGKPIPRIEIDGLDPVTEAELAEAATAPRRGRGGRADARGGRRAGGRGEARPEKRGSDRRGEGRGEKRGRDEAPREKPVRDAPPREERARGGRRDERAPRRDIEAETLREAEAPREARAPRRDAGRDDYRRDDRRRDRDRDDLGPAVQGFGDSVPAFMLIPIPRPRRESAAAEVDTDAAEAA